MADTVSDFIVQRLRAELKACNDPETIAAAAKESGLDLRTTKPRVYVVASLAGGSGSGMFLDLAYVVRAALRELGHPLPDVVGLFLLPPADQTPTDPLPLGNTSMLLTRTPAE